MHRGLKIDQSVLLCFQFLLEIPASVVSVSICRLSFLLAARGGTLAASISVGIVIPSTWFVYLYNILLA